MQKMRSQMRTPMGTAVQRYIKKIRGSRKPPILSSQCPSRAEKCLIFCAEGAPRRFRAEKCPSTCAEGAPKQFRAEKGIFSGAEWECTRLPSRKMPHFLRRRCSEAIPGRKMPLNLRRRCSEAVPGRKRHLFRRGMGMHPPPGQENAPVPAYRVPRSRSARESFFFS